MNKIMIRIIVAAISLINFQPSYAQKPVIIEFGWDYPDVDQLSVNLPSMQNTPFDGICFSLQRNIMEAFDIPIKKDDYYSYDKLKTLKWGKYNNNFFILRGFAITGGSWFDDKAWKNIACNMEMLSKAMYVGNIKGILFDPEYYHKDPLFNPWKYSVEQYPSQSLEQVQQKVKERGKQFVIALQKYQASFTFLSIWLNSLIAEEKKYTPLDKTRHVLLLSFIEGMLEGKNKSVNITDGNEYAYWNTKPSQFLGSGDYLKKTMVELMHTEKTKAAAAEIGIAQPIFYDGLLATAAPFDKGYDNKAKWNWLDESIKYALASTDSIVWFYSQRINWWKGNINDTLSDILQRNIAMYKLKENSAALKQTAARNIKFGVENINQQKGYYYLAAINQPINTGPVAFTYNWNAISKILSINFTDKLPNKLMVYTNNELENASTDINPVMTINLSSFDKGKMVILASYADKTEASGIQVYH